MTESDGVIRCTKTVFLAKLNCQRKTGYEPVLRHNRINVNLELNSQQFLFIMFFFPSQVSNIFKTLILTHIPQLY